MVAVAAAGAVEAEALEAAAAAESGGGSSSGIVVGQLVMQVVDNIRKYVLCINLSHTLIIEWAKILPFIEENVLPDTKRQNTAQSIRSACRTNCCMQDNIVISPPAQV